MEDFDGTFKGASAAADVFLDDSAETRVDMPRAGSLGRARALVSAAATDSPARRKRVRKHKTCKTMASLTIAQDRPACANVSIPSLPGPITTVALAIMPPCDAAARAAEASQTQPGSLVEPVLGTRRKPFGRRYLDLIDTYKTLGSMMRPARFALATSSLGQPVEGRVDAGVPAGGKRRAVGRER